MKNNTHTHSFASSLGRDLFAMGVEMAQDHKQALVRQESLLEALSQVGQPTQIDQARAYTDDEMAEMARYNDAERGRVNPHDA